MVAVVEVIEVTKHFGVDTLLHRQDRPVLHGSQPEYRSEKINGLGLLTLPYKLTNSGWAGGGMGRRYVAVGTERDCTNLWRVSSATPEGDDCTDPCKVRFLAPPRQ